MGLVDKIKNDVKKSGSTRGKFTYIRDGQKVRVRFLTDMDDGMEIVFHDSFERGINVPCRETFGHECKHCDDPDLRTRSNYIWSVWNYDTEQVELFMFKVNNCSPIPALMAMYENFGTITDRDYVISCAGKQMNKTFTVIPMDKVKFRNPKAKPYSQAAIRKLVDQAWPDESDTVDDFGDDSSDADDDSSATSEYEKMKPVELYKLCKERGIECEPKKPKKLYVNLLEEYDAAQDDWGDDADSDSDDDWDDGDDW